MSERHELIMQKRGLRQVYSPASLAERWECSQRYIRKLIAIGELPAFPLGGKLWRIRGEDVEAFECRTTASDDTGENSRSSTMPTEGGTVAHLEPLTRARLSGLRQRSMRS